MFLGLLLTFWTTGLITWTTHIAQDDLLSTQAIQGPCYSLCLTFYVVVRGGVPDRQTQTNSRHHQVAREQDIFADDCSEKETQKRHRLPAGNCRVHREQYHREQYQRPCRYRIYHGSERGIANGQEDVQRKDERRYPRRLRIGASPT